MKPSGTSDGKVWAVAIAGAIVVVLATLLLFHAPGGAPEPAKPAPLPAMAFKQQSGGGEADFYDPIPLFLPTKWNSRPNVLPSDAVREPGDDFRYEAKATPDVNAAGLAFPGKPKVPETAVEAQSSWTQEAPFLGFGEADGRIEVLPARGALVEVTRESDGRQVVTHVLPANKGATNGYGSWQPMEFLLAVEPAGLVGLPMPVPTSNPAEIVARLQSDLAKVLRAGQPLAPGFYRIKIGP